MSAAVNSFDDVLKRAADPAANVKRDPVRPVGSASNFDELYKGANKLLEAYEAEVKRAELFGDHTRQAKMQKRADEARAHMDTARRGLNAKLDEINKADAKVSAFRVLSAVEFAGGEIREPEWQISELLPRRGIGMVWGESGAGKSFWILDAACAIHRGAAWRDREVTHGKAVIVVAEGEHAYPLRLRAYAQRFAVPLEQLPAVVAAPVNLGDAAEVGAFIEALKSYGATLCVFDTLAMCTPGVDENSSRDMGAVVALTKRIATELDALAIVVHHSGKNADRGARGSSVLRPAMDVEIRIENDEATIEKLKDGAAGGSLPFTLRYEKLGVSKKGRDFGSLTVEHGESQGVGGARPSEQARAMVDIAARMLTASGKETVAEKKWREECRQLFDSKNRKRHFDRYRAEIMRKGLLVISAGLVSRRTLTLSADEFDADESHLQ